MHIRSTAAKIALIPLAALGALSLAGAGAGSAGASGTSTIKAIETDFHIALSKKSFSPGTYTFVAVNKGKTTHALAITGPGLKNADTADISPGQSVKLTVTFKDGKYDIYCPVPGHKMLGMNLNVTVKGAASHTTSSKKTKTPSTSAGSGGSSF
jgi:plastocyanin